MAGMRWKVMIARFILAATVGLLLAVGPELGHVVQASGTVLLQEAGELAEGDQTNTNGNLIDVYEFSGEAGQTVGITLESIDFDPMVGLLDLSDNAIAENNDIGNGNQQAFVKAVLPYSGKYQVGILPVAFEGTELGRGKYQITVVVDDKAKPVLSEKALKQTEANQLLNQAGQQFGKGKTKDSLKALEFALRIYKEIGDRQGIGNSLGGLGDIYNELDQYQKATELHIRHLKIAHEIGDYVGIIKALSGLGNSYNSSSQYRKAIEMHHKSLDTARSINASFWEASSLNNLGLGYKNLGEYDQAIIYYKQSLAISKGIKSLSLESAALRNIGNVFLDLSQHSRAIEFHKRSLAITEKADDLLGQSIALASIGIAYNNLGQYRRSIKFQNNSLLIDRAIGNFSGEAASLHNLANVYSSLGQYERSIDFYRKSLAIEREIENLQGEATSLGSIGNAYNNLGRPDIAIEFLQKSIAIKKTIEDIKGEADSLISLGNSYIELGRYKDAISAFEEALGIDRKLLNYQAQATSLGSIGNAHLMLGQLEEAINFLEQGLSVFQNIQPGKNEAMFRENLGATLALSGDTIKGEKLIRQSIKIYENLRIGLSESQLISIADIQESSFLRLEWVLNLQGKRDDALLATEQGRGQAFSLQLANRFLPTAPVTSGAIMAPSLLEIQQIARNTNTTLVTYSLIFNQTLNIYIIQPNGDLQLRSIPLTNETNPNLTAGLITNLNGPLYRNAPPSELTNLITDTRAGVVLAQGTSSPDKLKQLHTLLIDPIADLLPTDPEAKVAFIPDGNLFLVPFAALQDGDGTHLIEKHTLLTAPSIQVYGLVHDAAATKPLSPTPSNPLIVGDPVMPTIPIANASGDFIDTQLSPLPGAKAEAKAVGNTLNAQPLLGSQATEAQVKQQLPTADLIHLATHGLLQYGDPQAYGTLDFPGAIALTPTETEDGLLTSAELLEMDLQASLAILSACDTGRGRITGDGVVGLSRSLITAGVPSVIVSLWAVPDAPTAELMTEFYQRLSEGQDKAQALRQAMLITMKRHPNPRDWAAFTLMGSGS